MTTLGEYLAKGLEATLDEKFKQLQAQKNLPRQGNILSEMEEILTDMQYYENHGIPIDQAYIDAKNQEVGKLRNQWGI